MDREQSKQFIALEKAKLEQSKREVDAFKSKLRYDVLQLAITTLDKMGGSVQDIQSEPGKVVLKLASDYNNWINESN